MGHCFSDFSIPIGCAIRIFSAVCIKIEFLALLDDFFNILFSYFYEKALAHLFRIRVSAMSCSVFCSEIIEKISLIYGMPILSSGDVIGIQKHLNRIRDGYDCIKIKY